MSFELFYRNQDTEFGELAESVVARLYSGEEDVLESLARDENFAAVALPSRHSIEAGHDLSGLYSTLELTKRYMELALGVLHRMSCVLVTLAPKPSFKLERSVAPRAECTVYELLAKRDDERASALLALLNNVLRSFSAMGLFDVALDINNSLYRIYQTEKNIGAVDWLAEQISELAADYIAEREFDEQDKAVEFKKLCPSLAAPIEHRALEVPRKVPLCDHGAYMRPLTRQNRPRLVCWLASLDTQSKFACKKSMPISAS